MVTQQNSNFDIQGSNPCGSIRLCGTVRTGSFFRTYYVDLTGQVFFSQCDTETHYRAGLQAVGDRDPKECLRSYLADSLWSREYDVYVDYIGILQKVKKMNCT